MVQVTMRQLLEAGVHFGHQTKRWNPKMGRYILGDRNGIHVIDLRETLRSIRRAYEFVRDLVGDGGVVLFVGTKRQAQSTVTQEARRAEMPFVVHRWLGGTLTNWLTIRSSVERLTRLDAMHETDTWEATTKKERLVLERERVKLKRNLEGIQEMDDLPDAVFIIDPKREHIAVKEARRLGIPLVAVVDTNCDPELVDIAVPGNDDAIRSIRFFCALVADAVADGKQVYEERLEAERQRREEQRRGAQEAQEAAAAAVAQAAEEARARATAARRLETPELKQEEAEAPTRSASPAKRLTPPPPSSPGTEEGIPTS